VSSVPVLWPVKTLTARVVTPLVILRRQAVALEEMTSGILRAEVRTRESRGLATHELRVVAPALDTTLVLATVTHPSNQVYPCYLGADAEACLLHEGDRAWDDVDWRTMDIRTCSSQEEFIQELGKLLQSTESVGLMQSLIALSSEPDEDPISGGATVLAA
jgi:hypothetical protein